MYFGKCNGNVIFHVVQNRVHRNISFPLLCTSHEKQLLYVYFLDCSWAYYCHISINTPNDHSLGIINNLRMLYKACKLGNAMEMSSPMLSKIACIGIYLFLCCVPVMKNSCCMFNSLTVLGHIIATSVSVLQMITLLALSTTFACFTKYVNWEVQWKCHPLCCPKSSA